jgi:Ca2+-binding RTX toxin-like protein
MRLTIIRPTLTALALGAALATPFVPAAAQASARTCGGLAATIVGTSQNNTIHGTSGDDVIVGLDGHDTIYGGGGNDIICGNDQSDTIYGGQGDDVIKGGKGGDQIHAGAGNDKAKTDLPGSTVGGAVIADHLYPDLGDDHLVVADPADVLSYSTASSGVQIDLAAGTATGDAVGHDTITLTQPTAGIFVRTGKHADTVLGSAGPDHLTDAGGRNTVDGRDGDDVIAMGKGINHVTGGAGNDSINAKFNSYSVYNGADGNDTLAVQGSHDQVYGDAGDDSVTLTSAVWPDVVLGGGDGTDGLVWNLQRPSATSTPFATISLDLQGGRLAADTTNVPVTGFEGADLADLSQNQGQGPVASAYAVSGTPGDNALTLDVTGTGAPGGTLTGLAGDDTLVGGDGNDTLDGGPGTDAGDGRGGTDTCTSIENPVTAGQTPCELTGPSPAAK